MGQTMTNFIHALSVMPREDTCSVQQGGKENVGYKLSLRKRLQKYAAVKELLYKRPLCRSRAPVATRDSKEERLSTLH